MSNINYILFDAANTIIHKPLLWKRYQEALKKYNHFIPLVLLKRNHKLISECLRFPDRTSREFYQQFNSELLYSLGIMPEPELLDDIFLTCTYLPWEKYNDTDILSFIQCPMGVISNFNTSLNQKLQDLFGPIFSHIFISESYGVAKPNPKYYELAINKIGVNTNDILFIGDSIKLDIEPAQKLGMNAVLIDRDDNYPYYPKRIGSLNMLDQY